MFGPFFNPFGLNHLQMFSFNPFIFFYFANPNVKHLNLDYLNLLQIWEVNKCSFEWFAKMCSSKMVIFFFPKWAHPKWFFFPQMSKYILVKPPNGYPKYGATLFSYSLKAFSKKSLFSYSLKNLSSHTLKALYLFLQTTLYNI